MGASSSELVRVRRRGCTVWRSGSATESKVALERGARVRVRGGRCLPMWQTGQEMFGGSLKFNIY